MRLSNKTSLGIDISDNRISLSVLRRNKKGVELVKSATGPVLEGAIKNGNIEDPALLAKSIRELKNRSRIRIRLRPASVSLVANPVLLQIIEVSRSAVGGPTNVGQMVQNEVKHSVALSGKRIAMDFCGIGSAGQSKLGLIGSKSSAWPSSDRLFVVAADNQNVAAIVKACCLARVNVEVIEPPILAYARAFYAKKIAGRFDCNVLLAIVHGGTLSVCVFRKQVMDFVRIRDIAHDMAAGQASAGHLPVDGEHRAGDFGSWLADEINAVVQFYDSVGDSDVAGKWGIMVVANSAQLPDDAGESLRNRLTAGNLQIRRPEDAYQDTPVVKDDPKGAAGASAVAIGLAMKLLMPNETNVRINLLPPEAADIKAFKRHAIITANILAIIMFCMIIAIAALGFKARRLNEDITRQKVKYLLLDVKMLFREDKVIDSRIRQLSGEPGRLNEIFDSSKDVDWPALLNDIKNGTPKTVCIASLKSSGGSTIVLDGFGLSYEAIRWFVNMLSESKHIAAASLAETEKVDNIGGLIRYSINCLWSTAGSGTKAAEPPLREAEPALQGSREQVESVN